MKSIENRVLTLEQEKKKRDDQTIKEMVIHLSDGRIETLVVNKGPNIK